MNSHVYAPRTLENPGENNFSCRNPFNGTHAVVEIPNTVLTLLGVCREIYSEAMPIFYRDNHFIFQRSGGMIKLGLFLCGIGTRSRHVTEVTFSFSSFKASRILAKLRSCISLKKLHIFMDIRDNNVYIKGQRTDRSRTFIPPLGFRFATGVYYLFYFKGLEVAEIAGFDGDSSGNIVDINSPGAIGLALAESMMTPKEPPKLRKHTIHPVPKEIKRRKLD